MSPPKPACLLIALPLLALTTACGPAEQTAAAPAVTVTVTQSALTPSPVGTTPAPVVTTAAPVASTVPPVAAPPVSTAVMPNLVGSVLQGAQDQMQRVLGSFFFSTSHDADGQGRTQLIDSNWKVCDQTPAPGTPVTRDTKVDFGAVKLAESC